MCKTLIAVLLGLPLAAVAGSSEIVVLDVQKMTCALCSVTIRKALEKVPGVTEAKIDYDHKTAKSRPGKGQPRRLGQGNH